MQDNEKRMITKEVFTFYGIVIALILFYVINLSASLIMGGSLSVTSMLILLISAVIPEQICMVINRSFYMDVIFKSKK